MPTYGCHNKPRVSEKTSYLAQAGYESPVNQNWGTYSREPIYVEVQAAFGTTECQYTKTHATDKLCAGCIHQHKEET